MSLEDDLTSADEPTLTEILRQSEAYLSAQLTAGIAADQRGMSLVSLLAAAVAVIAGGGATQLLGDETFPELGWVCIATAAGLLAAMLCGVKSVMPTGFWYAGSRAEDWQWDMQARLPSKTSLVQQLINYDQRIKENNQCLGDNAWWTIAAVWMAWGTMAAGGATAVVLLLLRQFFVG
jgi:hypothetical protein